MLIFDDSFWHEAKHGGCSGDDPRVVFMLDIWHPSLTVVETDALTYTYHCDNS